ncbi:MAG: hypothetical protein MHM6MM_006141 [Cercozoa sp. M6MM]
MRILKHQVALEALADTLSNEYIAEETQRAITSLVKEVIQEMRNLPYKTAMQLQATVSLSEADTRVYTHLLMLQRAGIDILSLYSVDSFQQSTSSIVENDSESQSARALWQRVFRRLQKPSSSEVSLHSLVQTQVSLARMRLCRFLKRTSVAQLRRFFQVPINTESAHVPAGQWYLSNWPPAHITGTRQASLFVNQDTDLELPSSKYETAYSPLAPFRKAKTRRVAVAPAVYAERPLMCVAVYERRLLLHAVSLPLEHSETSTGTESRLLAEWKVEHNRQKVASVEWSFDSRQIAVVLKEIDESADKMDARLLNTVVILDTGFDRTSMRVVARFSVGTKEVSYLQFSQHSVELTGRSTALVLCLDDNTVRIVYLETAGPPLDSSANNTPSRLLKRWKPFQGNERRRLDRQEQWDDLVREIQNYSRFGIRGTLLCIAHSTPVVSAHTLLSAVHDGDGDVSDSTKGGTTQLSLTTVDVSGLVAHWILPAEYETEQDEETQQDELRYKKSPLQVYVPFKTVHLCTWQFKLGHFEFDNAPTKSNDTFTLPQFEQMAKQLAKRREFLSFCKDRTTCALVYDMTDTRASAVTAVSKVCDDGRTRFLLPKRRYIPLETLRGSVISAQFWNTRSGVRYVVRLRDANGSDWFQSSDGTVIQLEESVRRWHVRPHVSPQGRREGDFTLLTLGQQLRSFACSSGRTQQHLQRQLPNARFSVPVEVKSTSDAFVTQVDAAESEEAKNDEASQQDAQDPESDRDQSACSCRLVFLCLPVVEDGKQPPLAALSVFVS